MKVIVFQPNVPVGAAYNLHEDSFRGKMEVINGALCLYKPNFMGDMTMYRLVHTFAPGRWTQAYEVPS